MPTDDRLHTLMIGLGIDVCGHEPPCHPPLLLIHVLTAVTIDGTLWEIDTTLRKMTP